MPVLRERSVNPAQGLSYGQGVLYWQGCEAEHTERIRGRPEAALS